jgi:glycosyltransferase involved in cell wall biosynthesis
MSGADGRKDVYTDGGFPLQMQAIAELCDEMVVMVPCEKTDNITQFSQLTVGNIRVVPLKPLSGKGVSRRFGFIAWLAANVPAIWRELRASDAVHPPIPGDIGTIGIVLALLMRKPLFVRHCGNWMAPRTIAERMWKRGMEFFAGGRNVMLATGGAIERPSQRNPNIKWIFSTSLREAQMSNAAGRTLTDDGNLRLITVSRQERNKGTDRVIESLPEIAKHFPKVTLDVVGDGSMMPYLRKQAADLGVADRVTFHGKVRQPDVLGLLSGADIFCYPTNASEGFPKVVVEAMSVGLPVITTPVSVLPILIDDSCGIIIHDTSAQAIAAAVKAVADDHVKYEVLSAGAIERAKGYTLERWRDTIKEHLIEGWGEQSFRGAEAVRVSSI